MACQEWSSGAITVHEVTRGPPRGKGLVFQALIGPGVPEATTRGHDAPQWTTGSTGAGAIRCQDVPMSVNPPQPDDLITVKQAAQLLSREPRTITRWIRQGKLEAVRVGPATYVRRTTILGMPLDSPSEPPAVQPLTAPQLEMIVTAVVAALRALPVERS